MRNSPSSFPHHKTTFAIALSGAIMLFTLVGIRVGIMKPLQGKATPEPPGKKEPAPENSVPPPLATHPIDLTAILNTIPHTPEQNPSNDTTTPQDPPPAHNTDSATETPPQPNILPNPNEQPLTPDVPGNNLLDELTRKWEGIANSIPVNPNDVDNELFLFDIYYDKLTTLYGSDPENYKKLGDAQKQAFEAKLTKIVTTLLNVMISIFEKEQTSTDTQEAMLCTYFYTITRIADFFGIDFRPISIKSLPNTTRVSAAAYSNALTELDAYINIRLHNAMTANTPHPEIWLAYWTPLLTENERYSLAEIFCDKMQREKEDDPEHTEVINESARDTITQHWGPFSRNEDLQKWLGLFPKTGQ